MKVNINIKYCDTPTSTSEVEKLLVEAYSGKYHAMFWNNDSAATRPLTPIIMSASIRMDGVRYKVSLYNKCLIIRTSRDTTLSRWQIATLFEAIVRDQVALTKGRELSVEFNTDNNTAHITDLLDYKPPKVVVEEALTKVDDCRETVTMLRQELSKAEEALEKAILTVEEARELIESEWHISHPLIDYMYSNGSRVYVLTKYIRAYDRGGEESPRYLGRYLIDMPLRDGLVVEVSDIQVKAINTLPRYAYDDNVAVHPHATVSFSNVSSLGEYSMCTGMCMGNTKERLFGMAEMQCLQSVIDIILDLINGWNSTEIAGKCSINNWDEPVHFANNIPWVDREVNGSIVKDVIELPDPIIEEDVNENENEGDKNE